MNFAGLFPGLCIRQQSCHLTPSKWGFPSSGLREMIQMWGHMSVVTREPSRFVLMASGWRLRGKTSRTGQPDESSEVSEPREAKATINKPESSKQRQINASCSPAWKRRGADMQQRRGATGDSLTCTHRQRPEGCATPGSQAAAERGSGASLRATISAPRCARRSVNLHRLPPSLMHRMGKGRGALCEATRAVKTTSGEGFKRKIRFIVAWQSTSVDL